MKKNKIVILSVLLSILACIMPKLVFATTISTDLGAVSNFGGFISAFFTWAIPITASAALIVIIYAGFLYMTSMGNQESITLAKELLTGVVVGLILLFGAQVLLHNIIGTI
jgi:hypothetical protein